MGGEASTLQLIQQNRIDDVKSRLAQQPQLLNATYPHGYGQAPYGGSYLHWAVYYRKLDIVRLFVENNANVKQPSSNGNTPLHTACAFGDVEIAKVLIQYGADIYGKNRARKTPLDQCTYIPYCGCICHSTTMRDELLYFANTTSKASIKVIVSPQQSVRRTSTSVHNK